MSTNPFGRLASALSQVLLLAPALLAAVPVLGQGPPPAGLYVGPTSCAQDACHGATRPRTVYGVAQNELYVWLNQGPHAKAWEVLLDERSAAIARNLGLGGGAEEAPSCLSCHATAPPEELRAGAIEVADGVSCESCHGPASGWRSGHTAEDWSYEDSVAAGMTDLRSVATRARVCLGCHLGEPGRVVDHDLIAAGHPELRFELDNDSETMPPHWLPFADKPPVARPSRPIHGARAWAVGQAVALQEGVTELARRARGEGGARWPDFSWMSCDACHHDLAAERYRKGLPREFRARPGLPPWSPARWAVLRVLLERHAPDARAGLEADVETLARQVSRITTPPGEVAATAERIAGRLDGVAARLDAVEWDGDELRATLRDLTAVTADGRRLAAHDLASAEQVLQAVYSLAGALLAEEPELLGSGLVDAVSALADELEEAGAAGGAWDREQFVRMLGMVDEWVSERAQGRAGEEVR